MTDKKQMLHIKATSTSPDGTVHKAEATVPYIKGTMVHLPDEYPFSRNVMLDGDTGYSMRTLNIKQNGKIEYFWSDYYELEDGKAHAEKEIGAEKIVIDFTLTVI